MENLNIEGQPNSKKNLETRESSKDMRGKIIYNFRDGSVGIFDSLKDLAEAIGSERENYN